MITNTTTFSPRKIAIIFTIIALLVPTLQSAEPVTVRDPVAATHKTTGVRIVKGTVELPRGGFWFIENRFAEQGGLIEIYLQNDATSLMPEAEGERMTKLTERRAIQQRQYAVQRLFWACASYARERNGVAPKRLDQLEEDERAAEIKGVHYLPGVRLYRKVDGEMRRVEKGEPVLIDTAPLIDDGKHWVIDSTGAAERREIDEALVKLLGLTIVPARTSADKERAAQRKTTTHSIYARLSGKAGPAELTAQNFLTRETCKLRWDPSGAKPGNDELGRAWAGLRLENISPAVRRDAPLGQAWATQTVAQYELDGRYRHLATPGSGRFEGRTTGAMGVFGGRAAIQETLQLRHLSVAAQDTKNWQPSLPISKVPGVEVEPHPFGEMLGTNPGGRLPLAEWVPHDHFLAYFPKPAGLFSMLQGGSDFVFAAGGTMTGRSAAYLLKARYLDRMGLSEELLKRFLDTGAIGEMALTIPDLFLIDGTEMSAIMRVEKPLLATAAFALVGVPPGDGMTVKKNSRGEEVYWMRQGSILIVSTSKTELNAVLAARKNGENLAASSELRYMLTQVPVTADTAVYLYFSDPFIRALVGPRAKIGQLRRLMARTELEEASAAALLARYDGHGDRSTKLPFLEKNGYLRKLVHASDLALDKDAVSTSATYGTAARLNSLARLPLDKVSEQERKAYEQYLEEYNRYWRRFFDPIAVRYEKLPDGVHQIETFILPLVDNSLYGRLREFMPPAGADVPLQVPVLDPQPIAMMSLNLNEDAWLSGMENVSQMFESVLGLDGTLLDLLGPDLHLAVHDADPIVAMGNGELGRLFGQFGGRNGSEMFSLPALVSIFTRPCTIHIGLLDPDLTREKLARMTWAPAHGDDARGRGLGAGSLYQVTGQQKWIYRWSIEGLITLRFGIEVQDRYLVINNLPFSNPVSVTGNKRAPNDAGYLELNPAACVDQLPALFASAVEQSRKNATGGAACLLPFMISGTPDLATAREQHRGLFGFAPFHPAGGSWTWKQVRGELVSSLYGPPWSQQQPAFDPENDAVGLLRDVSHVDLGMQFEQDGLRSTVRWTLR